MCGNLYWMWSRGFVFAGYTINVVLGCATEDVEENRLMVIDSVCLGVDFISWKIGLTPSST